MGERPFDLISWGETLLRLSPPAGFSLEESRLLEVWVGGSESNVACALARLGGRVAWVSRLPDNALGRRVAREIAGHGVDTSRVLWAEEEKMGLGFIETGTMPRANTVLYDRAHSAMANLVPEEMDYGFLASGKTLHLTGITPALSESCRRAWLDSARRARKEGCKVALDLNYRARLWDARAARWALEEMLPFVDVVLGAFRDFALLFELSADPVEAAEKFSATSRVPLVVITLGAAGALAFDGNDVEHAPAYATQVVDRIGAGDAFAAGFHFGWGRGGVADGLRCGNAMAALKQTYRGDVGWSTREEVLELADGGGSDPDSVKR